MNLIQIKQIDGLESSLNSLSSSQYVLGQEVSGSLGVFDTYWDQLYWNEKSIEINSAGDSFDGDDGIALGLSNGGFSCLSDSYFKNKLTVKGDLILDANSGQLMYKNAEGDLVRFAGAVSPNYESVLSASSDLTPNSYIVGVDSYAVGSDVLLTLPPPSAGKEIIIKDEGFSASANAILVLPNDGEMIDNKMGATISGSGSFLNMYSNGTDWFIVNHSGVQ